MGLYKRIREMKKIKLGLITLSTVLVVATAAFTISSFNQKEGGIEKRELLSNILVQSLDSYHYQPVTLDDEYSKTLFKQYVESLDYNKRILLQSDVDKLKEYELKLDEQVIAYSFDFFDLSYKILEERLEDIQKIYPKVLSKPVSLKSKETIELDSKKVNYPANKSELEKIWKNRLTYEVIAKVYSLEQEQIKAKEKSDTVTIKSLKELEVDARKKVLKNYNDWFRRLSKVEKKDRLATYMNSITTMYDPHTNFFPPKQKENFDISISGKLEGIGATLQEKDGYVKVIRIVPGSASWKQGDLKSGDLILKVGQADAEPVSIVDMRLDDAVKLIRGKKGSEVRLTIRKIDGEEKTISIIRDVVILEETYAKSAVITDSITGKKIGLINLPKFYADFSDAGTGRNCADDVKKEIIKLKGENVDGIAIDLRDNGGGSLRDVVTMGGFFIKDGPIVQVKDSKGKINILSDTDTLIQYDGPLVIMVNELSASASEILAAAMQDYNRAIIMGSTQTYGKGTVQRFIDLDYLINDNYAAFKPLGAVKLTIQKFYRINGGTTQKEGVASDIVLPDAYEYLDYGEKELDNVLEWDEIPAVEYNKLNSNFDKITSLSTQRVKNNEVFGFVNENAKRLKNNQDNTLYPLNYELYKTQRLKEKEEADKFKDIFPVIDGLQVNWTAEDLSVIEADTNKQASFDSWKKSLKKDPYIFEALKTLEDY